MNKLFNNMLPYEMILSAMGAIIFLALVFLLIWNVLKQRSVVALLPFYLLPVIMVGYPSISVIKFNKGILEVDKYAKAVYQAPTDTAASRHLKEAVAQLKDNKHTLQDPNALASITNAQIALGKYDSASLYLDKIKKLDSQSNKAQALEKKLHSKIEIEEKFSQNITDLNDQIRKLKQSPGDTVTINKMAQTLSAIQVPVYTHPDEILTLSKSYAILGNKQQSLVAINKLLAAFPADLKVKKLKDSIANKTYQLQFYRYHEQPQIVRHTVLPNRNILNQTVIRENNAIHNTKNKP